MKEKIETIRLNKHPVKVIVPTREITLDQAVKNSHEIVKRIKKKNR